MSTISYSYGIFKINFLLTTKLHYDFKSWYFFNEWIRITTKFYVYIWPLFFINPKKWSTATPHNTRVGILVVLVMVNIVIVVRFGPTLYSFVQLVPDRTTVTMSTSPKTSKILAKNANFCQIWWKFKKIIRWWCW